MEHLAIMKKSWGLLPKILNGDKKIESRWYMAKFAPWNKIKPNDIIYFKNSGEPVTVKAEVEKVLQFEDYDDKQLKDILERYGEGICFNDPLSEVLEWAEKRKYCILIFLKNPQKIEPFGINKKGFGNACAWICTDNINKIKL